MYCNLSLNLPSSMQPLQKIPEYRDNLEFLQFFWKGGREGGGEGESGGEEER